MALSPAKLLEAASHLLASPGQVSDERVRRAASTVYYALFHCLAGDCADLMIGKRAARLDRETWRHAYRALDHGETRSRCANKTAIERFSPAIREFADTFVVLQAKRHQADYDPHATIERSEILAYIGSTTSLLGRYRAVEPAERRAFCAYLVFRARRD